MRRLQIKAVIIGSIVGIASLITSCGVMTNSYGVVGSSCINGFWGKWHDISWGYGISGETNNFFVYDSYGHPSNWGTHFIINGLHKKDIRGDIYRYSGSIEFYSHCDTKAKAIESLVAQGETGLYYMKPHGVKLYYYKVPVSVEVSKKSGHLYYFFFYGDDGIGIGIPINNTGK